jgi:hypothetical protein
MQVTGLIPISKRGKQELDSMTLQILEIVRQLDSPYKELALSILRTIRREQDRLGKKA